MATQNTLYIAEPIFSQNLIKFNSDATFPPIKKIGITTGSPKRRERELLGTMSPVKISIVRAWTVFDAKIVESSLHDILDNLRLDGEYFWDGKETLVDSVTNFITQYYPEAKLQEIHDDLDVVEAANARDTIYASRISSEVLPKLEELGISAKPTKNEKGIYFHLAGYKLRISAKTVGRYSLTIFSKFKSTKDALEDFIESEEPSGSASEDSSRKARIPLAKLDIIIISIKHFMDTQNFLKT